MIDVRYRLGSRVYQAAFNFSRKRERRIDGAPSATIYDERERERKREREKFHGRRLDRKKLKKERDIVGRRNIKRIGDDPRRRPLDEEDGSRSFSKGMDSALGSKVDGRREPEEEEAPPASVEPGILRIFEDEDSRMHAHASAAHLPLSLLSTLTTWMDRRIFKPRLLRARQLNLLLSARGIPWKGKRKRNEDKEEEEEEERRIKIG